MLWSTLAYIVCPSVKPPTGDGVRAYPVDSNPGKLEKYCAGAKVFDVSIEYGTSTLFQILVPICQLLGSMAEKLLPLTVCW